MGQYENDKIMFNVKIGIVMFAPFGPNILIFVWISTFLLFYVEAHFSQVFIQSTSSLGTLILRFGGDVL